MSGRQTRYLSYLLRLWQDNSDDQPIWRASLQSSPTENRQGFASLDELFAFLRQQVDTDGDIDKEYGSGMQQRKGRKPPSAP
jgi:hypothetical protein